MVEDEDSTAHLLRLAGARMPAPRERAARVRLAVHDEWRETARRRTAGRRRAAAALVLAAAGVVAAIVLTRRDAAVLVPAEIVARIEGKVGGAVRAGEWAQTGTASGLALRLPDGTSVRLDVDSRVRLLTASRMHLTAGAIYIDASRDSAGLEIQTAFGTVRDIGTQFEVRLRAEALSLRVRTGIVELHRGGDPVAVRAGTELAVTARDTVARPVPAYGPEWAWTVALAPPFEIEGRTMAAFVEHLSREHGWNVRYTDAALARTASSIVLHGSVSGLEPDDALAAALAASDLVHQVRDGELLIARRTARGTR